MDSSLGLRQRAVASSPATAADESASSISAPPQPRTNKPAPPPPPARPRAHLSIPLLLLLAILVFAAGFSAGVVGTCTILFTGDYPRLEPLAIMLMNAQKYPVEITIGGDEEEEEDTVISCDPDQPLVERRDDVLDPGVFAKVQNCLRDHPQIAQNELSEEGFNGTRGFVINFSLDGVDDFLTEEKLACDGFNPLRPFFDAARHPETNGFVMNVLVCDKPTKKTLLAVGEHVDDTLDHTKEHTSFLAHTVSVMYISLPGDMKGGELELLGSPDSVYGPGGYTGEGLAPALEKIVPKENMHAEFRGDSLHRVRAYETDTADVRVSLVLEQYKVPEEDLKYLVKYAHKQKNGMTMM